MLPHTQRKFDCSVARAEVSPRPLVETVLRAGRAPGALPSRPGSLPTLMAKTNAVLSIRNCEIGVSGRENGAPPRLRQNRCILVVAVRPRDGIRNGMDAETRRRQLAAAIARVAAGDRAALHLVYAATSAKLFGVCLRILGDRSEAEDVLQEVSVWRKAGLAVSRKSGGDHAGDAIDRSRGRARRRQG